VKISTGFQIPYLKARRLSEKMNQIIWERTLRRNISSKALFILFLLVFLLGVSKIEILANNQSKGKLATIKGIVIDESGKPIVGAVISIFRTNTERLLKQIYTDSEGGFLTKVFPGSYKILASAEGYSSQTIESVQINRSGEFSYGFRLERVGAGRTLPEKAPERNSPKYVIRSAKLSRSIYQNSESDKDLWDLGQRAELYEDNILEQKDKKNSQTAIEYYKSDNPSIAFAHFQSLSENLDLFIIGQIDSASFPRQKFQSNLSYRLNPNHEIRIDSSFVKFNGIGVYDSASQVSLGFSDEWKLREGVLVVLGLDYSNHIGKKGLFSPKAGVRVDLNPKTRIKTLLSSNVSGNSRRNQLNILDSPISDLSVLTGELNDRFEVSLEKDFTQGSNLEIALFFDKDRLQKVEKSKGLRVIYSRRLNKTFSFLAGYAFSRDEKKDSNYQSFLGQVNANLRDGTRIQAILRLSPEATILTADPFRNNLTIYDPGLSIFVIHPLPSLGLPIRAEAILDARNLFDIQYVNEKRFPNLSGRVLRGGILVKF
jgi:hypothetical protein